MKKRGWLCLLCAALLAGSLLAAAALRAPVPLPGPAKAGEPLTLMVATDLHFLSPSLTDGGPFFMQAVERGDGKLVEYMDQVTDALADRALELKPDALILTGDLTLNGERESLADLAEKLRQVQAGGVPVLLLPGNHDIGSLFACRYEGDTAYLTTNISQADFRELCGEFGPDRALAAEEGSFSYVYEAAEDLRLLFLDANTAGSGGKLLPETLRWAEEQLKAAKEAGAQVITVTHQNMLPQSSALNLGYVIGNWREALAILREGGVKTNLSGHSHFLHRAEEEGFTDYCTEALSVTPLRYALLELNGEREVSYRTESLPLLQREAAERFDACSRLKLEATIAALEAPEEQAAEMLDYAVELNRAYFTGELDPAAARADPRWELWQTYGGGSFWLEYMESMTEEDT